MPYVCYFKQLFAITFCLLIVSNTYATTIPPLVSTEWLDQHRADKQIVIIDMSDTFQYQRFHIPGARHLPYGLLNQQTRQGVSYSVGSETVAKILGQLGVTPAHTVVIYDDTGGLNAARLYWELQRLRHINVALLDGGLVKWIRQGRNISWTSIETTPTTYPIRQVNSFLLGEKNDITKAELLLDVRSKEEYLGYPQVPRSGHIPGARHFAWDNAVDFAKDFTMKPASELKAELATLGIADPHQEVTVYCQSGHRAAHTFFTLKRLGWNKLRLYDGSMAEYEQDKSKQLKRGARP